MGPWPCRFCAMSGSEDVAQEGVFPKAFATLASFSRDAKKNSGTGAGFSIKALNEGHKPDSPPGCD